MAIKIVLWIGGSLVAMTIFNFALSLISAPNTPAVVAGTGILLALVFAGIKIGQRIMSKVMEVKGLVVIFIAVLSVSGLTGCAERIDPGYAGIKVNYYGSEKGVQDYPLVTGMVWYNPITETVFEYPTFVQQAVWTKDKSEGSPNDDSITVNSVEGLAINTDIGLAYHLERERVPAFYVKFRTDKLESITQVYLRNVIRDSFNAIASTMKVEDIYGPKKEELLFKVKELVNKNTAQDGIVLDQLTVVGAMRLPGSVVDSLNAKIKATQDAIRTENELRQAEAEAKKIVAEAEGDAKATLTRAKSQAEANRLLAASISPVLVNYEAIKKWNGALPQVSGGAVPFINLPSSK